MVLNCCVPILERFCCGMVWNAPFELFVVGHSCGLSDKTMLETIFGSDQCKAIKIYHYKGWSGYFEKSIQISRHFKDKAAKREKLMPFRDGDCFPKKP
jgi:3-hydroxyisobutyrate dehydrogenase-like beta-hydroxyacid dehydrogenase